MPIFMHDKDGKYVVRTLEEVTFPLAFILLENTEGG